MGENRGVLCCGVNPAPRNILRYLEFWYVYSEGCLCHSFLYCHGAVGHYIAALWEVVIHVPQVSGVGKDQVSIKVRHGIAKT